MPYTNDSNVLQQSINLLNRTANYLNEKRGEDAEKSKTPLQEDIENFILLISKPKDTFFFEALH